MLFPIITFGAADKSAGEIQALAVGSSPAL